MKQVHPIDIGAGIGYIAAGGLASVAAALAILDPGHSAIYTAGAVACASIAGFVRLVFNLTPLPGTKAVVTTTTPPTSSSLRNRTEGTDPMNIGQTLLNIGLMYLISSLKGGAQATAEALAAGQPVTAAKLTLGPNEFAVVTVQLESK